jgi:outer membrane protein TolC
MTLQESLKIARERSIDALNAKQKFRVSFWAYRSFRSSYLPKLTATGTLPDISRVIPPQPYQNPDGSYSYIPEQTISNIVNLSLQQKVGYTGGYISLNTGLSRFDNIQDSTSKAITSYWTTPINISYSQPLFKFNQDKWDRTLKPLAYDQAKQQYLEDIEQVSINTTTYFFNLLQALIDKKIADTNYSNYSLLFKITQGRYTMGTVAENDLLQFQLQYLQAKLAVENANLALQDAIFRLRSFLRIQDTIPIIPVAPDKINFFIVDPSIAQSEAINNSSAWKDFDRRLIEASMNVNMAKMNGRFDADLSAGFGYNQSASTLGNAYKNPLDQELIHLQVTIPIVDWGTARGEIKQAESQQTITKNQVAQDKIDFAQQVYLDVMHFNLQKDQVEISATADSVSKKSYMVTKNRYLIGKINDFQQLYTAQINTDNAEKNYYSTLENYWQRYFNLRKSTLYDFENHRPIMFNLEDVKP